MNTERPGPRMIGGQPFRRAVLTEPEPTRLADAIEVARAAYQAGRIEEARDALDQELKRRTSRPSSGEADLERARAQTLLAILHLASDDRSMAVESATEAVTLLRQAAESGRLPQWCQGDYGIALQITGENDDAIDVLQDAVKIPSLATPDVYRHLGLAYAAKGRFADAEEWLDQTVAAVPGDVMARIAYAEVLAHQDRASDAAAAFAEGAGTARDRPEVAAELADRALLLDRRIEYLVLKGDALRMSDRFDEALEVAEAALEEDPDSASALALRGRTLFTKSLYAEAIPDLRRAVELDDTRLYACSELAFALYVEGHPKAALDQSDRALDLARHADPAYVPQVLIWRGLILLELDEPKAAIDAADEVLALDRVNLLHVALARVVRGYAHAGLDQLAEAVDDLHVAIRMEPDLADLYFDIAEFEQRRGRQDDVIVALGEAVQHATARRVEARGLLGKALIEAARIQDAKQVLELALAEDPDSALAIGRMAEVLRQEGTFDEALAAIDQSLELDPESAENIGTKGQILASLGEREDAISELQRALDLDEGMAWAHAELGELRRLDGAAQEALEHLERAIELAENDSPPWLYGSQGAALQALGRPVEALEALDTAIDRSELPYGWAMGVKGIVLFDLGRVDEGLAELERATTTSPDLLWLRHRLGFALLETRHPASAEGVFRRAQQLAPGDQRSAKGRAAALEDLDRLGEAIEVLSEARSRALEEGREDHATDLLTSIGHVYLLDGRFEAALNVTITALEESPTLGAALSQCGDFLRRVAEFEAAATVLERSLEDGASSLDYYRLGLVHEGMGEWQAARSWYESQVQLDPSSLKGHRGLGESLLHLGDPEGAAAEFLRVVDAFDQMPDTKLRLLTAALCHYRLGNLSRAMRFLTEVIDMDSEQMSSQMALGLVLFAGGRMSPAIRQHLQAVSTLTTTKNPMHQRGVLVRAVESFDDYLAQPGGVVDSSILGEPADEGGVPLTELMYETEPDPVVCARSLRWSLASSLAEAEARYQSEWHPKLEPLLRHAEG